MNNAFGLKVYEIKDVFQDKKVEECIKSSFVSVLLHLGIQEKKSTQIVNECLNLAKSYSSVSQYELEAHQILASEGVTVEIPKKLAERADLIYGQIKPHLLSGSILDLGCGDAKVAVFCADEGHKVTLVDVYKHPNVDNTKLEFRSFEQGAKVPVPDGIYDNTLVLTVFHHSDDPVRTIKEAYRVTKRGGRVLVIESVYGVNGDYLSREGREKAKNYLLLTPEQQRKFNIFFDHFYNRVIHYSTDAKTKVNVPFNFNTPDNWKKLFEKEGFEQEKIIHLGIDQPSVPEYHTLHILKKVR